MALLPAFAFAGAFLMFVLEPLVGRVLLPAYGGGFQVWTTCLMFFQGVLLLGYLYAHFVGPRIGRWHVLVAALPLALLPIDLSGEPASAVTVLSILGTLFAHVALPIAVLSTTGVLAQAWLAGGQDGDKQNPYWLYAASNAGSLLGLLAYPFLIEPFLGVRTQRLLWSALYVAYVVLAALVAPRIYAVAAKNKLRDTRAARTPAGTWISWLALSAAPSIMLMAVTNAISFDVGSIPLVWVAPLAVYLTTFILVFGDGGPHPRVFRDYWPEAAVAGLIALGAAPLFPSWPRLALHLGALFAICMTGHAELYRLRPAARDLTKFYLVIALGGWIGGVFVSIAAPALFDTLLEYPIAIALLVATLLYTRRERIAQVATSLGDQPSVPGSLRLQTAVRAPVLITGLAFASAWMLPGQHSSGKQLLLRNNYGVYQVGELRHDIAAGGATRTVTVRQIVHNGTMHGGQVIDPDLRHDPIAYYHRASGFGDVARTLRPHFRLGVVGLGTGSTAAYVGPKDEIVYYEIDPDDEDIARRWFSYLSDCRGKERVVIGDARITLATDPVAPDGHFDALLIDAFNGDAIPTHLLTVEAIDLYERKLKPGGVLMFNITNRFYDLRPVLGAASRDLGFHAAFKARKRGELEPLESRTSSWAMSADRAAIDRLVALGWTRAEDANPPLVHVRTWTDDHVNVLAPLWAQLRTYAMR